MKRGLAPLLGIAFVVALAASGIFYGVFANRLKKAAERPVVPKLAVATRPLERGTVLREGIGVAKGMRALSVHVVDSSGLMPLLRPGDRVDVQAVQNRGNSQALLRTILQNIEVLSSQAQVEGNPNLVGPSVVTLLVSADNQDGVALADSGANIRLVLRNPADVEEVRRPSLMLASLFNERPPLAHGKGMDLLLQVGHANGQASSPVTPGFAVVSRRPSMEVFLSKHIAVYDNHPARVNVASGFSIRVKSWASPDGGVRLQMQPELTTSLGTTTSMRSVTAGLTLADGQSAVMTGLNETLGEAAQPNLVVMITAHQRR